MASLMGPRGSFSMTWDRITTLPLSWDPLFRSALRQERKLRSITLRLLCNPKQALVGMPKTKSLVKKTATTSLCDMAPKHLFPQELAVLCIRELQPCRQPR